MQCLLLLQSDIVDSVTHSMDHLRSCPPTGPGTYRCIDADFTIMCILADSYEALRASHMTHMNQAIHRADAEHMLVMPSYLESQRCSLDSHHPQCTVHMLHHTLSASRSSWLLLRGLSAVPWWLQLLLGCWGSRRRSRLTSQPASIHCC